jgi:small-conductance mechanosensitive channel
MNFFESWLTSEKLQSLPIGIGLALEGASVFFILVLGWVLSKTANRVLARFLKEAKSKAPTDEDQKRIETLIRAVRYVITLSLAVMTGMMVLARLGISIAPFLATAGVAGIAVGFGAQSLVKDYFTGLVLLLEDQIRQGDSVEVAGKSGLVEELTLRYVRLRDYEGAVHIIPNGVITTVSNRSRSYAYAVVEVGVNAQEEIDRVLATMRQVGQELRADPLWGARIQSDLEIAGVESWVDSSVLVKGRIKTQVLEQWAVKREFLVRLKRAFEKARIRVPDPSKGVLSMGS